MSNTKITAKKGNRQYTINEAEIKLYQNQGYDIYECGKLVKHGAGKVIAYTSYQDALEKIAALESEIAALKAAAGKAAKKAAAGKAEGQ
jgi:uncharacterized small protein (DUF1192 family)